MQAVILAAGRGKRLYPITTTRTKAMAPLLGKPIIERVMEPLRTHGISEFILIISPEDTEIKSHFENNSRIDTIISMVPQPNPLGMGHALQCAIPYIHDDFVLSACDNLVDKGEIQQLFKDWTTKKPDAILTTIDVEPADITRMGIVALEDDRVTRIVEKPILNEAPSNIGSVPLYIFSQKILTFLDRLILSPRGEYELQDAIQMMIEQGGNIRSFHLSGRTDLTTPEDLLRLNLKYFEIEYPNHLNPPEGISTNHCFFQPVYIEGNVIIGSNCKIGPNVYLEHGCEIGDDVRLKNVLVFRNRKVSPGTTATNKLIW